VSDAGINNSEVSFATDSWGFWRVESGVNAYKLEQTSTTNSKIKNPRKIRTAAKSVSLSVLFFNQKCKYNSKNLLLKGIY
jgi:hypothetical protein